MRFWWWGPSEIWVSFGARYGSWSGTEPPVFHFFPHRRVWTLKRGPSPSQQRGRDGQHSIELRSYAAPARQPPVELTLPLTELGDTFGESVHEDVEPSSPLLEQQQRVDGSASAPRSTVPQPPTEATTAASS